MSLGRPLKFKTPEEMQEKIDAYFASRCDAEGNPVKPISITGLALALDTTRELLCNYEDRDAFHDTIKRAKLRVENFYEERLIGNNAAGPIFALKNFDWKDKSHNEHSGPNGGPIETRNLTKEQRDAAVAAALDADR